MFYFSDYSILWDTFSAVHLPWLKLICLNYYSIAKQQSSHVSVLKEPPPTHTHTKMMLYVYHTVFTHEILGAVLAAFVGIFEWF